MSGIGAGCVFLGILLGASPAWSWGHEGHRVVARIAAKNLSAEARGKVAAILETNDAGVEAAMASAATWPDEIDKAGTGTRDWHFIDVPVDAPFSATGLCPAHACVIDQIEDLQRRLRTNATDFALAQPPTPPRAMTSQELAFLIHFVGDVHQPLHAATNGDRGGNCVELKPPFPHADGSKPTAELHALWDVDEVEAVFAARGDEEATATALFQRFKAGGGVPQRTPVDWAEESNGLAKTRVYQLLHIGHHHAAPGQCASRIKKVKLDGTYLSANVADVEQQLLHAGIRLSNLLNQICAGGGCQARPKSH